MGGTPAAVSGGAIGAWRPLPPTHPNDLAKYGEFVEAIVSRTNGSAGIVTFVRHVREWRGDVNSPRGLANVLFAFVAKAT